MRRYTLHSSFSINHFSASEWLHSEHKHTYFEIIFILSGSGKHIINGHSYAYIGGEIYLLGPEDAHYFVIETETEFSFVRFNESQHRQIAGNEDRPWRPIIHRLLSISSQSRGSIVLEESEKNKLFQLLSVLEAEVHNSNTQYYSIVRDSLIRTMLILLARNLLAKANDPLTKKQSIDQILAYLKQHIFYPKQLTITQLAETFHYSPNYISYFFKKHTGQSIKQYITKYKMALIESRLENEDLSLTDIVYEFGFTDESHLCKQYKKYAGTTPRHFIMKKEIESREN